MKSKTYVIFACLTALLTGCDWLNLPGNPDPDPEPPAEFANTGDLYPKVSLIADGNNSAGVPAAELYVAFYEAADDALYDLTTDDVLEVLITTPSNTQTIDITGMLTAPSNGDPVYVAQLSDPELYDPTTQIEVLLKREGLDAMGRSIVTLPLAPEFLDAPAPAGQVVVSQVFDLDQTLAFDVNYVSNNNDGGVIDGYFDNSADASRVCEVQPFPNPNFFPVVLDPYLPVEFNGEPDDGQLSIDLEQDVNPFPITALGTTFNSWQQVIPMVKDPSGMSDCDMRFVLERTQVAQVSDNTQWNSDASYGAPADTALQMITSTQVRELLVNVIHQ